MTGGRRQRLDRVRAAMASHGVDALLLSLGADLPWLTGYQAMPLERLTMLVLPVDAEAGARAAGAQRVVLRRCVGVVRAGDRIGGGSESSAARIDVAILVAVQSVVVEGVTGADRSRAPPGERAVGVTLVFLVVPKNIRRRLIPAE